MPSTPGFTYPRSRRYVIAATVKFYFLQAFDVHAFIQIQGRGVSRWQLPRHFSTYSGRRHARTLVHKARWRFRPVGNAQPGRHEAEIGGYPGNAACGRSSAPDSTSRSIRPRSATPSHVNLKFAT